MIILTDYEVDGKVDWTAYHAAQEDAGERCYQCGNWIIMGRPGRSLCQQCLDATKPGKLRHDCLVRCPECGHLFRCYDMTEDGADGYANIDCPACAFSFEVEIAVSYLYTSPARNPRP